MPSQRIFLRILLGCCVAGMLFSIFYRPAPPPQPTPVKALKDRQPAPDFELKDAAGQVVRLSDYKGKVVLLDFWATWCGPCGVEIPWFKDFQRRYKDRGFEVLGVSMDPSGWKDVKPFVADHQINYRILMGDEITSDRYGGLEALPTTFVIDREGRIASVHIGLVDKEDFENAIRKLLETPATAGSDADRRGSVPGARPNGA